VKFKILHIRQCSIIISTVVYVLLVRAVTESLKSTFSAQQFRDWQCGSIFIRLAIVTPNFPNMRMSAKFPENLNLQQFKTIQGRWFWYQSKARMRLPISH